VKIAVIDGQGGGIGKLITEKIRKTLPPEVEIIALGTNAMATSLMLRAGAPNMAKAVAESKAIKLIIPLTRSAVEVIGARKEPLPHQIDLLIEKLQQILVDRSNYKG
jgi:hypothetical protein